MLFPVLALTMAVVVPPCHRIEARLSEGEIRGEVEFEVRNETGEPVRAVAVAFPGGKAPARFGGLTVRDGKVELAPALAPGGAVRIRGGLAGKLGDRGGYRASRDWYPRLAGVASYEVTLDVSARDVVASSGRVISAVDAGKGRRMLKLRSGPVSSFGLAVSPDFRVVEERAGNVQIMEYQVPRFEEWNRKGFAQIARDVVLFYGAWLGEYPHDLLVILPGSGGSTGGSTVAGNMVQIHRDFQPNHVSPGFEQWITAHEVGHMLWGFETVLDEAELDHWIGLGFGIWSDRHYMVARTRYGEFFQQLFMEDYQRRVAAGHVINLTKRPGNGAAHDKGVAVVQMLEQVMGEERFFAFARNLQKEYRWRLLTVAGLRVAAEKAMGGSLEWFFRDFVERDERVDVAIGDVRVRPDGQAEVMLRHTGPGRLPVVVEVVREDGRAARGQMTRGPERQVVAVPGAGAVRLVRVDPDGRLPVRGPNERPFHGRPWVAASRDGAMLVVTNGAQAAHDIIVRTGAGKARRTLYKRVAAGERVSIDVGSGEPLVVLDTTDRVRIECR